MQKNQYFSQNKKRGESEKIVISQDLLNALRDGDHTAYERIYYHYKQSIEFFLRTLTRSNDMAQEITQEVFVALWVKREQIDPTQSFKSYLYRIARNATINYFNHQRVRSKYAATFTEEESGASADEMTLSKEIELLVEIAVSRMPKQRRQIFEMSRYEGLSNGEIAERLQITTENVASQIYLASKEIKKLITLFLLIFSVGQ